MDLMGAHRQTFGRLVVHTPFGTSVLELPWTLLDVRLPDALSSCLRPSPTHEFETAKVNGRTGQHGPHRPRRPLRAADRRRARLAARARQRLPAARRPALARAGGPSLGRGRRHGAVDRPQVRAGRVRLELPGRRGGPGGRGLVRPALPREGHDRDARRRTSSASRSATRATGSRTACAPATADGVFFVGDSAGHCLPLTAEGIRTALYFGIACGRELRAVIEGRAADRLGPDPLRRLLTRATAGSSRCCWPDSACVPRVPPRLLHRAHRRDAGEAIRRLELRPLPEHRPAELRERRPPRRAASRAAAPVAA